ncbi:phage tail protein [Idiomarina xiamenensis]|uniref:Antifreeze protein n=1 Tax=Idiomarina xiamenensis 10-D-4 TaxID=740709 RepID=K2KQF6_9GAMM|nr:phage tail protein [Idiomarina xiamenensis]EKE79730.1 antifreeze protein [Idiomarina xiamenensis 10-D-4]
MPPVVAAVAVGVAAGVAYGAAIGVLVGIGMVALQNSIKPEMPSVEENFGQSQTLTTQTLQARRGIYGESVVSGSMVGYGRTKRGKKDVHVVCITLAGHAIDSAELYEINGNPPHAGCEAHFYDGTQTEVSEHLLEHAENWTEEHVGYGVAYAVVFIPIDPDKMANGLQNVTFKVRGSKVYDPRKDSSVGGSGSHRADSPNTWEWSDNSILCALDYVRFKGFQKLSLSKFDIAHIAEQANICDEQVAYLDNNGATQFEKRFTANGNWSFDESPPSVLQRILTSCGGKPYRRGGKIYLQTASYHGLPTVTLTESDAAEIIKISPHRELRDRINLVRASFMDPRKRYEPTDAPVVKNSGYINSDGMELEEDLQLSFTKSSTMAQRLMKYHMERNRAGMRIEFPCKAKGLLAMAGQNVRVELPNEGIEKEFIVADWSFDRKKKVTNLVLEEESPALYSDDLTPTEGDLTPNTNLPDFNIPLPPESLAFELDAVSTHRQGYVTWTHPVPRAVSEYIVSIKKANTVVVVYSVVASSSVELRQDINGLDAGDYSVEIVAKNRFERMSAPAALAMQLQTPSAPISLGITPGNWEATSAPVLEGIGLGTVFEFAFGDVENVIGRGISIVQPGLKPDTEYTFLARTVNPLGKSGWIQETFRTTKNDEQISPWLQGIREELDAVDLVIDNISEWSPARDISEQFTAVFDDYQRESDNRATLEVAQDAGRTADGALEVVNGVKGAIDDPETGLGATFSMAQSAKTTADGTAESMTSIASGITGEEDEAKAILQMKAYLNEGGLAARAFLGTDAYGRTTGVIIGDDGVTRQIQFTAGSVGYTDGDGQLMIFYDLERGRYVFDGHMVARSGLFAGELQAATGTFSGTLNAVDGTFKGTLQAAKGTFAGDLEAAGGTFNGELNVKSAESGVRTEITNELYRVYGSNGVMRLRLGVWDDA